MRFQGGTNTGRARSPTAVRSPSQPAAASARTRPGGRAAPHSAGRSLPPPGGGAVSWLAWGKPCWSTPSWRGGGGGGRRRRPATRRSRPGRPPATPPARRRRRPRPPRPSPRSSVSHLDSHIRQKIAQRDAINLAARWLADRDGLIVEFGLGNGRSYSHLVERFPGREVFCFDRRDAAHPRSRPPADHFYPGEFAEALADRSVHARFAGRVILLHVDVGCGGPEDNVLTRETSWEDRIP